MSAMPATLSTMVETTVTLSPDSQDMAAMFSRGTRRNRYSSVHRKVDTIRCGAAVAGASDSRAANM